MPTLEIVNSESLKGGRRIMGIDPGTQVMGYGVVQEDAQRQLHLVVAGAVSLVKVGDPYQRLCEIYRTVQALTGRFSPGEVAIEAPFFGKNAQSMLKLGRAQGVAIAAIIGAGYPIFEYAPRRIKQARALPPRSRWPTCCSRSLWGSRWRSYATRMLPMASRWPCAMRCRVPHQPRGVAVAGRLSPGRILIG